MELRNRFDDLVKSPIYCDNVSEFEQRYHRFVGSYLNLQGAFVRSATPATIRQAAMREGMNLTSAEINKYKNKLARVIWWFGSERQRQRVLREIDVENLCQGLRMEQVSTEIPRYLMRDGIESWGQLERLPLPADAPVTEAQSEENLQKLVQQLADDIARLILFVLRHR